MHVAWLWDVQSVIAYNHFQPTFGFTESLVLVTVTDLAAVAIGFGLADDLIFVGWVALLSFAGQLAVGSGAKVGSEIAWFGQPYVIWGGAELAITAVVVALIAHFTNGKANYAFLIMASGGCLAWQTLSMLPTLKQRSQGATQPYITMKRNWLATYCVLQRFPGQTSLGESDAEPLEVRRQKKAMWMILVSVLNLHLYE